MSLEKKNQLFKIQTRRHFMYITREIMKNVVHITSKFNEHIFLKYYYLYSQRYFDFVCRNSALRVYFIKYLTHDLNFIIRWLA